MPAERGKRRRNQSPAGLFIALGLLGGAGIGIARGQPSLGTIIGLTAGIVLAAAWALLRRG